MNRVHARGPRGFTISQAVIDEQAIVRRAPEFPRRPLEDLRSGFCALTSRETNDHDTDRESRTDDSQHWLAHTELYPKAPTRHLLGTTIAIETTAARLQPAHAAAALVVTSQSIAAVTRMLPAAITEMCSRAGG